MTTGQVFLRRDEVLHIPGLGFDGLIGYSPIAMAKNAVGMAIATEEYGATFFANGANPGGVLEHPGVIKDPGRQAQGKLECSLSGRRQCTPSSGLEEGMKFHQHRHPAGTGAVSGNT